MDALTALANGLNLRAKLVYAGGVCGQWLMDHNSDKSIWFHLVSKGRGWVHSPAWAAPLELADGDLILFLPHAAQHFLSYSPAHLPSDMDGTRVTNWSEGETGFVCGEIELAVPQSPLWRALPAEIVIRKAEAGEILARLIELIIAESASPRFGSDSVIERLCDSLFILVVRHCIETNLVRQGVFAAMQDSRLATVLQFDSRGTLAPLDDRRILHPRRIVEDRAHRQIQEIDRCFSSRISDGLANADRRAMAEGIGHDHRPRGRTLQL